jgi:hypothetical protein
MKTKKFKVFLFPLQPFWELLLCEMIRSSWSWVFHPLTCCNRLSRHALGLWRFNLDKTYFFILTFVWSCSQALEKFSIEKDIAAYIKKEFDKKYNPTWHVIVGRNFGEIWNHLGTAHPTRILDAFSLCRVVRNTRNKALHLLLPG